MSRRQTRPALDCAWSTFMQDDLDINRVAAELLRELERRAPLFHLEHHP